MAFGTLLVAAGVYEGGGPSSGAQFFFLWVIPYAFAFFSTRQAAFQTALMAASYAIVLAVQLHQHPALGPGGLVIGMWLIAVTTVIIVGTLARRLSRSLRDVDRRFHRSFVDSPIGAAFVSTDLIWLEVNDALARLLRRTREELIGHSTLDVTHPDDVELSRTAWRMTTESTVEFEKRYLRPDGSVVWAAVSISVITPEVGERYHFTQCRDITEHKRDREALEHQAVHDPLTRLFNRTLLARPSRDLARARRAAASRSGVILLDLDQFKLVNDSLGHQHRRRGAVRDSARAGGGDAPGDTLSRFGGDEFVVLCDLLLDPMDAHRRARATRIRALSAPVELSTGSTRCRPASAWRPSTGPADTA